jgi:hypothetical protein
MKKFGDYFPIFEEPDCPAGLYLNRIDSTQHLLARGLEDLAQAGKQAADIMGAG